MRIKLLFLLASFLIFGLSTSAQFPIRQSQYFDGFDTIPSKTIAIHLDPIAGNIWQIGKPSKIIFDSAATLPNAIVTDTLNNYPAGNLSSFSFYCLDSIGIYVNLIAFRWKQKLDMEKHRTGVIVEFSRAGGRWENIFNNPHVYRLYGYAFENKDTLFNGEYAFSGLDTVWRDIWLCFPRITGNKPETQIRFTFVSDTGVSGREGCMIDNILAQATFAHTIKSVGEEGNSKVYPTITNGPLIVEASRASVHDYVRTVQIISTEGRLVRQYNGQDFRMILDISALPAGTYQVKVHTDSGNEVFPIVLQH